jgi:hypothetical protein
MPRKYIPKGPRVPPDPLLPLLLADRRKFPDAIIVIAVRDGARFRIWCPYCARRHSHGDWGKRTAHCFPGSGVRSEEKLRGYILCPAHLYHLLLNAPKNPLSQVAPASPRSGPDEPLPGWRGRAGKMPGPPP